MSFARHPCILDRWSFDTSQKWRSQTVPPPMSTIMSLGCQYIDPDTYSGCHRLVYLKPWHHACSSESLTTQFQSFEEGMHTTVRRGENHERFLLSSGSFLLGSLFSCIKSCESALIARKLPMCDVVAFLRPLSLRSYPQPLLDWL